MHCVSVYQRALPQRRQSSTPENPVHRTRRRVFCHRIAIPHHHAYAACEDDEEPASKLRRQLRYLCSAFLNFTHEHKQRDETVAHGHSILRTLVARATRLSYVHVTVESSPSIGLGASCFGKDVQVAVFFFKGSRSQDAHILVKIR